MLDFPRNVWRFRASCSARLPVKSLNPNVLHANMKKRFISTKQGAICLSLGFQNHPPTPPHTTPPPIFFVLVFGFSNRKLEGLLTKPRIQKPSLFHLSLQVAWLELFRKPLAGSLGMTGVLSEALGDYCGSFRKQGAWNISGASGNRKW